MHVFFLNCTFLLLFVALPLWWNKDSYYFTNCENNKHINSTRAQNNSSSQRGKRIPCNNHWILCNHHWSQWITNNIRLGLSNSSDSQRLLDCQITAYWKQELSKRIEQTKMIYYHCRVDSKEIKEQKRLHMFSCKGLLLQLGFQLGAYVILQLGGIRQHF